MSEFVEHDLLDNGRTRATLESNGFKVYVSTAHSLEAVGEFKVLQVIQLDNGEYRASRLPKDGSDVVRSQSILPELGEVKKWLSQEAESVEN